jgi:hypothetical protein
MMIRAPSAIVLGGGQSKPAKPKPATKLAITPEPTMALTVVPGDDAPGDLRIRQSLRPANSETDSRPTTQPASSSSVHQFQANRPTDIDVATERRKPVVTATADWTSGGNVRPHATKRIAFQIKTIMARLLICRILQCTDAHLKVLWIDLTIGTNCGRRSGGMP